MKIDVDRKAERLLREMISKNSRYGTMSDITSEAIESFYQSERKGDSGQNDQKISNQKVL